MRSARLTALLVLGGALAGGLAIQAADDAGRDDEAVPTVQPGVALPVARSEPTLSSTWYCAGGTATDEGFADHVVLIANPTDRARTATVTVFTGVIDQAPSADETTTTTEPPETTTTTIRPEPAQRVLELPAQSRLEVRLGDISEAQLAGAAVEVDGGQIAVEHQVTGPRGQSTAPCSTTASPTWSFPWGVTTRGQRELLVLMNPYPDTASVDITFATNEGFREPGRFEGFIVPGRSVIGVDLGDDGRRQHISAHVQVRRGRIVVDRIQTFDGTEDREGIALGLGVPAPAETWLFPEGEVGGGLFEQVVVYNPSDEVAEVEVEVRLDDPGEVGPPEPFELTVPPGRYSSVDIHADERVPEGEGHALIVRSLNGVPITAERVNWGVDPAAHTGITATSGSPFGASTWYFAGGGPIDDERDHFLVLLNLSTDTEVTYSLTGFRGGQTIAVQDQQDVTIAAGGRAVVRVGDHNGSENLPLVVTADGPIVAERGLYGIGTVGLSQAIGIPLDVDLVVPDPVDG